VEVEDTHLTFCLGDQILYVSYDPTNNLLISQGVHQTHEETTEEVKEVHSLVTSTQSQNLSNAQKELLRNHFKFGHLSMQHIQAALCTRALAHSKTEQALHLAASKCEIPKCAACQFAKARKRPLQGQRIKQDNSEKEGNLKKNVLLPGQCVACDHFVSSAKGRLFTGFGKTEASKMYSGACVLTDLATGYMHVELQVSFDSSETLQATARFEALMKEYGITVSKYMFDNGSAFTSSEYKTKLAEQHQKSQQAGVGAHSQNIAECAIQTISAMGRTIMIHAARHWPSTSDTCLWPMAVKQAEYIHNRFPTLETGLSPYELLTQSKFERMKLMDLHVWGCPTYVLDPKIQDGKKLP
jgi:hypothetical protein